MTFTAPRGIRTLVLILVVLGLSLAPLSSISPSALADGGMESSLVSKLNAERAKNGLSALSTSGDLTSVARSWSGTMADQGKLYHNPNLGSSVSGWQKVGENVGRGPSVDAIHAALMASSGHKANILGSDWTQVGVGVVVEDGTVWVTQVFRQPTGAPPPAPKDEPEDEPKNEPEDEPKNEPEDEPEKGSAKSSAADEQPKATSSPGNSSGSADSVSGSSSTSAPDPESDPEPEPHEVSERPLPMDRVTLMLARLEATDLSSSVEQVLATYEG